MHGPEASAAEARGARGGGGGGASAAARSRMSTLACASLVGSKHRCAQLGALSRGKGWPRPVRLMTQAGIDGNYWAHQKGGICRRRRPRRGSRRLRAPWKAGTVPAAHRKSARLRIPSLPPSAAAGDISRGGDGRR